MDRTATHPTLADREIERYDVPHHDPGRDLRSLVELLADICEVPHAAINLVGSTQQQTIVTSGIEVDVCAREDSMCAIVMDDSDPVVVTDASLDPRFAANPFVTGEIGAVRFYASAPIVTPDGVPIGRLCVFDDIPRELSALQRRALGIMAAQVMDLLELRYRSQALETSLDELTHVRDELRRTNEHLTLFAGQVSHDLRTPLSAILMNAELLATTPSVEQDVEVSEMIGAVREAGQRMETMIAEMLSFARKGGRVRMVETDLRDIVDLVITDIDPLLQDGGADITVGELPPILSDPDLIYSVMLNLVTNAIKFARPGTRPTVEITSERRDAHWRIRVTDDGVGVPQERQKAMFDLFARADQDVAGHGIGLATAKRIVKAHHGTIGMESPDSGGTSVWFDLPI